MTKPFVDSDLFQRLIELLRSGEGFVSGEDISRRLNLSRSAVWKHVQELRRLGYEIQAVTHQGYQLRTVPDAPYPWEVKTGLTTRRMGHSIFLWEECSSTQNELLRLAREGAPCGTVVLALRQTQGRGRMGRVWVSPEGGLYFSVLLRPSLGVAEASQLTLMAAVAVCRALDAFVPGRVKIKWPNDILCDGRKVAGILTELHAEMDRIQFILCGIGVNVKSALDDLPPEAISLQSVASREMSRTEVVQKILTELEKGLEWIQAKRFHDILDQWKMFSVLCGRTIMFVDSSGSVKGRAMGVSPRGALLIKDEKGRVMEKFSGDVRLENAPCR